MRYGFVLGAAPRKHIRDTALKHVEKTMVMEKPGTNFYLNKESKIISGENSKRIVRSFFILSRNIKIANYF
jgi:hypothetical protein